MQFNAHDHAVAAFFQRYCTFAAQIGDFSKKCRKYTRLFTLQKKKMLFIFLGTETHMFTSHKRSTQPQKARRRTINIYLKEQKTFSRCTAWKWRQSTLSSVTVCRFTDSDRYDSSQSSMSRGRKVLKGHFNNFHAILLHKYPAYFIMFCFSPAA